MNKRMTKLLISIGAISTFLFSMAIACSCASGCEAGNHQLKKTILEPTCGTPGKETSVCTKCGLEVEERIIPATGDHVMDDGEITKVSTCTVKGTKTFSCTKCGEVLKTEEMPLADHTKDDGVLIEESTCDKAGILLYYCIDCGAECGTGEAPLKPHEYILADNYWELSDYLAPTETQCAIIPYECKVCKQSFAKEYNEIDFAFANDKIRMEDKFSTDTPIVFDVANKYLTINLAGKDSEKTLQTLAEEQLYNAETKVLIIPAVYKTVALEAVKVRGFKTPYDGFAMTTEICNQMNLILENISYTAPNGIVGLDFRNVNEVSLEVLGLISINGGQGGMDGIAGNKLEITGSGSLTVAGGNGTNGTSSHGDGTSGGIGLKASELTLSVSGVINITGGNGGTAFNRLSGDNDGEGSNGRNGYAGGSGGIGVSTETLTITEGKYVIVGGNGARGGDASECNRSEWVNTGSKNVVGGKGGNGGNGAVAIDAQTLRILTGTLSLLGGNGGDSGKKGGCHNDDHSGFVLGSGTTTATDGSAGTAGKGNKGLSENCVIEGDDSLVTMQQGTNGKVTTELNQC